MRWLKANWRWAALNVSAAAVMLAVLTLGSVRFRDPSSFDAVVACAKWALRFLLICLAMTPLNTYFGWKHGIGLRKSAGLWAFGFGLVHILVSVSQTQLAWLDWGLPLYVALGLAALAILSALAITSNRRAMKWLGKGWKRLHRLVYLAGGLIVAHALVAAGSTKRLLGDTPTVIEIGVYAAILAALLILRLPGVRQTLLHAGVAGRASREAV